MNIQENVALSSYTTFRIGGPARWFTHVQSEEEIRQAIRFSLSKNVRFFILGGGSNVLISDSGFDGLVIHLQNISPVVEGKNIRAFAGTVLFDVVKLAQKNGLSGIEKLAGIPGSIGGAVRGNAGAFGMEIGNSVNFVSAIDVSTGIVQKFSSERCLFSYRNSLFKQSDQWILSEVGLLLHEGDGKVLSRDMRETVRLRESKHRQDALCAGSFFMNPIVHNERILLDFEKDSGSPSRGKKVPAGWLIDRAGLRGKSIGGAKISEQHPNYIINTGNATAENIVVLMSIVKQRVRDAFEIELTEEVQLIGFSTL